MCLYRQDTWRDDKDRIPFVLQCLGNPTEDGIHHHGIWSSLFGFLASLIKKIQEQTQKESRGQFSYYLGGQT